VRQICREGVIKLFGVDAIPKSVQQQLPLDHGLHGAGHSLPLPNRSPISRNPTFRSASYGNFKQVPGGVCKCYAQHRKAAPTYEANHSSIFSADRKRRSSLSWGKLGLNDEPRDRIRFFMIQDRLKLVIQSSFVPFARGDRNVQSQGIVVNQCSGKN